jgi:DNA-binding transcriptional regulator YdaS (Cro superfamily)
MSKEITTAMRAMQEACAIFDSASGLARAIDVTPMMVSYLLRGERDVSLDIGIAIEKATHGKVRIERLCPKELATIEYLGRRAALMAAA